MAVPAKPLNQIEHELKEKMEMETPPCPVPFVNDNGSVANADAFDDLLGRTPTLDEALALSQLLAEPAGSKYAMQIGIARELGPKCDRDLYLLACELEGIDPLIRWRIEMDYTTGNPARDNMLRFALRTANNLHREITPAGLADLLPPDFDLGEDEIAGMLGDSGAFQQVFAAAAEPTPAPAAVDPPLTESAAPAPEASGTYSIDPNIHTDELPAVKSAIREDVARRQLDTANRALSKARDVMAVAAGELRERRTDLSGAIMQWQLLAEKTGDGLTREQRERREVQNHIAAQNAERARRVAMRNNSAARFVQRRMQNGPSRGGFSREAAARAGYLNNDPRRGPVFSRKLPSER
ncbi:MAG: hypothetical protein ACRECV_02070 [Xanthobacteraceae bacterium]